MISKGERERIFLFLHAYILFCIHKCLLLSYGCTTISRSMNDIFLFKIKWALLLFLITQIYCSTKTHLNLKMIKWILVAIIKKGEIVVSLVLMMTSKYSWLSMYTIKRNKWLIIGHRKVQLRTLKDMWSIQVDASKVLCWRINRRSWSYVKF